MSCNKVELDLSIIGNWNVISYEKTNCNDPKNNYSNRYINGCRKAISNNDTTTQCEKFEFRADKSLKIISVTDVQLK